MYFYRVGTIYEELRFSIDALNFPLFFIVQRIIFAVLAIYWGHSLGQMFVLYLMSMGFIMYLFVV